MKVSDQNSPIQLDAYIRQMQQQKTSDDARITAEVAQGGSDKVELSDKAKQIQKVAQEAIMSSDVNEEKVKHIKMEIEKGTYKVAGAQVATDMLREAFENDVILHKINTRA